MGDNCAGGFGRERERERERDRERDQDRQREQEREMEHEFERDDLNREEKDFEEEKENESQLSSGAHSCQENIPIPNSVAEAVGNIVKLCKTHDGSRFVQDRLEDGSPADVATFFAEMKGQIAMLMMDSFGHFAAGLCELCCWCLLILLHG